jgi:hypothetical protein
VALLPGIGERVLIDIDSLLRPVYGHLKQGASFGHAKIASRALLWRGLSPTKLPRVRVGVIPDQNCTERSRERLQDR